MSERERESERASERACETLVNISLAIEKLVPPKLQYAYIILIRVRNYH